MVPSSVPTTPDDATSAVAVAVSQLVISNSRAVEANKINIRDRKSALRRLEATSVRSDDGATHTPGALHPT
jgi:hypothetical protein